jgi:hypothetical protein
MPLHAAPFISILQPKVLRTGKRKNVASNTLGSVLLVSMRFELMLWHFIA